MNSKTKPEETKIALFRNRKIRKTIYKNERWFSVVDIVGVLSDSENPHVYWRVLKKRLLEEGSNETVTNGNGLKMLAADGKMRITDCANTEGIFRIIQSTPSPKAELFKLWLARVGYERIQEIEDSELAQKRSRALYKAKGYPDDWIKRRIRSIAIREELTDEWKNHGVKQSTEYEILTAEIAKAAFGVTPSQHKKVKGLKRENLRDHMTDLELLFSMLGEASTTEITRAEHPEGFEENKHVSRRGGKIAGDAREKLEKETGKKIVTKSNHLPSKKQLSNNNK